MIVCHCHGITDREIRDSVHRGALDCWAVAEACGAGAACGGCSSLVGEVVSQERRRLCVLQQVDAVTSPLSCRAGRAHDEPTRQSA